MNKEILPGNLIYQPDNLALSTKSAAYPGFPVPADQVVETLTNGQAVWLECNAGDLLRIDPMMGRGEILLIAACANNSGLAKLVPNTEIQIGLLDRLQYDRQETDSRISARGLKPEQLAGICLLTDATTSEYSLSIPSDLDLVLVMGNPAEDLVLGNSHCQVKITLQHELTRVPILPDPLWTPKDEIHIPRASARAYHVKAGEYIQVLDVDGRQCSDFMALNLARLDQNLERFIDSTVSRTLNGNAYPTPGLFDKFFDQDMTHMLSVIQDTVGRHDTFALACTAKGYEDRGFPGHLNCSDNISDALEPEGVERKRAWPAINFFFNSWIDAHQNQLSSDESWSRAGDYVLMQAQQDLLCVSTACPDDIDPINGWNPTDIHVRIYDAGAPFRRSVAYRSSPDASPRLTDESPFHSRTSKLTQTFMPARDYWMPQHYDSTGAIEEYWACKKAATLQDMSGLRKFDVTGPDAERLLQACLTRNVAKLAVHRGAYSLICDDMGTIIDDGTLFRLAPDLFRWCCGSDESARHLTEQAAEMGLKVWIHDITRQMGGLAIQGPKSRDILKQIVHTKATHPSLENLKWFGQTFARIGSPDGPAVMLTRSGFTGELGYEIFCDHANAADIWDMLLEAGTPFGLVPMGGQALDMLRIEAGLMIAGAEFGPDLTPEEAGLSFAVDMKKDSFVGRAALERLNGAPRHRLTGLILDSHETPSHGEGVYDGRRLVGHVTSAVRSPELGKTIAMARLNSEAFQGDRSLEVGSMDGHMKRVSCELASLPFIDPKREKARA